MLRKLQVVLVNCYRSLLTPTSMGKVLNTNEPSHFQRGSLQKKAAALTLYCCSFASANFQTSDFLDIAFTYTTSEAGILQGRKHGLSFPINMGTILHISITEPHICLTNSNIFQFLLLPPFSRKLTFWEN